MKISVILPVKNPDINLLDKALSSVHSQTYKDYEILLVNDGSDRVHTEELRKISAENQNIRLFEIAPSGVSSARNYAAHKAEGEFLTYLDGDDFLSPVCFEEAIAVFENNDIDAVWGGTVYGTEEELTNINKAHAGNCAFSSEELQKRLLLLNEERKHLSKAECIGEPHRFEDGSYISRGIAGRFIKKEKMVREGIEFPQGIKYYEDAIWNLKMLDCMKVAFLDSPWYYYMDNETSVSNAYNPSIVPDLETSLAIIRELIDMDDAEEYAGYTRILMDSLRYVSRCLCGNPKWNAGSKEKKGLKKHLYQEEPWKEIGTEKYKTHAQSRDCRKAALYRIKLLLFIWKYRWE